MESKRVSNLVEIVEQAIDSANRNESKLSPEVLRVRGHGTVRMSHFINALCGLIPDCRYLEFGTFAGRSLAAAAYKNVGTYRGVDKFQWTGSSITFANTAALKSTLAASLALCVGSNVGAIESDFRLFKPELDAYDVFFYDADHGYEATRDGILQMSPWLRPGVVIVDDYLTHGKSELVKKGTLEAVAKSTVVKQWVLSGAQGWHTGLYVAVIDSK